MNRWADGPMTLDPITLMVQGGLPVLRCTAFSDFHLEVKYGLIQNDAPGFPQIHDAGCNEPGPFGGPAVRNVIGANDRIGIGLIGAGDQGRFDFSSMMRTGQVDPIAVRGCLPTAARR